MVAGEWKPTYEVVVEPDSGAYFAQCKALDYCASGMTVEETKDNFSEGLQLTAMAHKDRLPPDHMCAICSATGKGLVSPNFVWLVLKPKEQSAAGDADK